MRTLILFVLCIICFYIPYTGNAQTGKIPPLVTKAFSSKYPTSQNVIWNNQGNEFKASFNADGFKYEAKFNNDGDWKITQREISRDQLPAAIRTTLSKSDFADWNTQSTYILFLPGMITQYQVVVAKNDNKKSLLFSQDGKLLKDNFTL